MQVMRWVVRQMKSFSQNMSQINFEPWIGDNYKTPIYNDVPILVLGESHYGRKNDYSKELTKDLVERYLSGKINKSRFWTTVAQFVANIHNSDKEFSKSKIWNDFAFYNYIQKIVGIQPRINPDLKKFRESEKAFFQVIDKHKPKLVIALGSRLYSRMYPLYEKKVKIDEKTSGRIYDIEGHKFLCTKVRHPSAGFSYGKWHTVIEKSQSWLKTNSFT